MATVFIIFPQVTIDNYNGYWMQTQGSKLVFCSKQTDNILECEKEGCTMNCHDTYDIENHRIISKRDPNVIGLFNWNDGIRWINKITWIRKG